MGPLLYLIFTHDLPVPQCTVLAVGTFADDTAALSVHKSPIVASQNLQAYLDKIYEWLI